MGNNLEFRPNEFIKYRLFTPGCGLEDKVENYGVTSYALVSERGRTKVELIHQDNRQNGFAPATLKPILAALKRVAEMTDMQLSLRVSRGNLLVAAVCRPVGLSGSSPVFFY